MSKAIYNYFSNKQIYPNCTTQYPLPISKYDFSKYAMMNGKYGNIVMSHDAKCFYTSICKMAVKRKNGLYILSDDYKQAETSYKISISFAMGMLAARIIAAKIYGVSRLYHFTDSRLSTKLHKGKMAPDWFGLDKNGTPFLFESKGTTDTRISYSSFDHADKQLKNVLNIVDSSTGKIYKKGKIQKHIIGSCFNSYNGSSENMWQIHDVDPEEIGIQTLTINVDKECFMYYKTFVMLIGLLNLPYQRMTIGDKEYCCWTYGDEKYFILEKIYSLVASDKFSESNKYRNFNNYINELVYSMDYWESFLQNDISTFGDGIIVCNASIFD